MPLISAVGFRVVHQDDTAQYAGTVAVGVDQLGAASGASADIAEHPDLLERHRQIGGLAGVRQRFGRHRGGQALQRRIEHYGMDSITAMRSGLVRQDYLGFRRAVGLSDDPGQRGERLPVM